jgi:hypothetical protein
LVRGTPAADSRNSNQAEYGVPNEAIVTILVRMPARHGGSLIGD